MNTAQLQAALNQRTPTLRLSVDGIAGKATMGAVDGLLRSVSLTTRDIAGWNDARRRVAAEQIIFKRAGIEVGAVDGLVGEQTRYARTVWEARQANAGKPDPNVENWRDAETVKPSPVVTPAHQQWPRQRDVQTFYGAPGTHQAMLELPFPMRVAWNPEQLVHRFSCHVKIEPALKRIWRGVLNHYGHDRIVALRLDLFGGCLNVRKMRGGSSWSMHAFGIAQDVDPDRNQLKFTRAQATLDDAPYDAFWSIVYGEGALSLGRERNYDWMHFQFTRDFS